MRTIISFAIALFIHAGVLVSLLPKKNNFDTAVLNSRAKYQTIDLTKFSVQKRIPQKSHLQSTSVIQSTASSTTPVIIGTVETPTIGQSAEAAATTVNPTFLKFEEPEYPQIARIKGLEGKVRIKVSFNDQGTAGNVLVVESSTHQILDDAVKKSALKWVVTSKQNSVFEKTFEFKLKN
jgi:TonB family protein